MADYTTGTIIKRMRKKQNYTQSTLAEKLGVTDKAVSKWETSKSFPDVTLLQPLAQLLGISVAELLDGRQINNANCSGNTTKTLFYVCPVCGNVVWSLGETMVSCHGITLEPLVAKSADENHCANTVTVEDEYYVTFEHPQSKTHYYSFVVGIYYDKITVQKLYPEQQAEVRLKIGGLQKIYTYCNKHGFFCIK